MKTEQVSRHDGADLRHVVNIVPNTRLAAIAGARSFEVNSLHREALVAVPDDVVVSAYSDDGIIEAVELPDQKFAIGVQWHQEKFCRDEHPGNPLFDAFIAAAS